jgi:hypothetical protein
VDDIEEAQVEIWKSLHQTEREICEPEHAILSEPLGAPSGMLSAPGDQGVPARADNPAVSAEMTSNYPTSTPSDGLAIPLIPDDRADRLDNTLNTGSATDAENPPERVIDISQGTSNIAFYQKTHVPEPMAHPDGAADTLELTISTSQVSDISTKFESEAVQLHGDEVHQ